MGRPTIDKGLKRSEKTTFRLTKKEQLQLNNAAEACGISTGNFIRLKLFKGKFPQPKPSKIDIDLYYELKKIGVNLNQIARRFNLGQVPSKTNTILQELLDQQQTIIRALLNDSYSKDR